MLDAPTVPTTCPECQGTGKDPIAIALEKLSAVLPLRCERCNGTGRHPDGSNDA